MEFLAVNRRGLAGPGESRDRISLSRGFALGVTFLLSAQVNIYQASVIGTMEQLFEMLFVE